MAKPVSQMTAYAKHQRHLKKEDRRKKRLASPQKRGVVKYGKCGARKKDGSKCGMAKGWGTDHPGIGACKLHGGAGPGSRKAAIVQQAIFMGAEKHIHPHDAIMWCIRVTAGEVEWLSERMSEIEKEDWYEHTVMGRQMHVLQRERAAAQDRLVKYSKDALSLGLAERAVRLAEQYGHVLGRLLKGILGDLDLSAEQQKLAPHVIRKHLVALESAPTLHPDINQEPVAALPRRV